MTSDSFYDDKMCKTMFGITAIEELNVRRCKRLRTAKKNLGLYAQKMAKWIDEWNEMISKLNESAFETGNLGDEAKEKFMSHQL